MNTAYSPLVALPLGIGMPRPRTRFLIGALALAAVGAAALWANTMGRRVDEPAYAIELRDGIMVIGARLCHELAVLSDAREIKARIEAACRHALTAAAKKIATIEIAPTRAAEPEPVPRTPTPKTPKPKRAKT